MRISAQTSSLKSDGGVEGDIAVIKKFFELDAIETYGSIPSLRKALYDLETTRKNYQETGTGYLKNILRCWRMHDRFRRLRRP